MKVLLLAAGRSQRVKPIADKNFLRFCGKPLIQHQVEALIAANFTELILIGGAHNLDPLKAFAKEMNASHQGVEIEVVEQTDLDAGMAGAVLSTKAHIEKEEAILIVSSNDVVEAKAYQLIFDAMQNPDLDGGLLGKKVTEYFPGGYLEIDKDWMIQSMVEKPGEGNEPSDLVNLVLHFHRHPSALLERLESTQTDRDDRYEVALDSMMKEGKKLLAIPYDGYWQPIKYPWHVFAVAQHFFSLTGTHIASSASIDDAAVVRGDVIIDEGAKVLAGATIMGPAYIGKKSIVATNALVRDSYLGENCVIGFSTEVARSFLGDDVWTHSNYIGDSIIGNNVSFGAGTVTGNLRFDEGNIQVNIKEDAMDSGQNKLGLITGNNIRTGINTSFMPGIKVGSGSLVGAGIVVNEDIPESSFVRAKTELKISPNKSSELASREGFRNQLSND
jgi:NDP-sugar pyrophosphorylase family protein